MNLPKRWREKANFTVLDKSSLLLLLILEHQAGDFLDIQIITSVPKSGYGGGGIGKGSKGGKGGGFMVGRRY